MAESRWRHLHLFIEIKILNFYCEIFFTILAIFYFAIFHLFFLYSFYKKLNQYCSLIYRNFLLPRLSLFPSRQCCLYISAYPSDAQSLERFCLCRIRLEASPLFFPLSLNQAKMWLHLIL